MFSQAAGVGDNRNVGLPGVSKKIIQEEIVPSAYQLNRLLLAVSIGDRLKSVGEILGKLKPLKFFK